MKQQQMEIEADFLLDWRRDQQLDQLEPALQREEQEILQKGKQ